MNKVLLPSILHFLAWSVFHWTLPAVAQTKAISGVQTSSSTVADPSAISPAPASSPALAPDPSSPTTTTTTTTTTVPRVVGKLDCRRTMSQDPNALSKYVDFSDEENDEAQWVLVKTLCRYTGDPDNAKIDIKADLTTSIPDCPKDPDEAAKSKKLCVAKTREKIEGEVGEKFKDIGLYALMRYGNRHKTLEFTDEDIKFNVVASSPQGDVLESEPPPSSDAVTLGGGVKEVKCRVFVSGATDDTKSASCSGEKCEPSSYVTLKNGKLVFDAILEDVPSDMVVPKSIKWSGGPDKRGVWEAPPGNEVITVRAEVESKAGDISHCALQFRQLGKGYTLSLNKYGECPHFRAMRDYYMLNSTNTGIQIGGYSTPLTIPGFDAAYGKSSPDIPFRGVYNAALDLQSRSSSKDGRMFVPPIQQRQFTAAVVVGRALNPKLNEVGKPLFWGLLDPLDYKLTSINSLDDGKLPDNTLISFQFFLAHKQMVMEKTNFFPVIKDSRGKSGIPLYEFRESFNGVPFDRLVPVMNDSCMPIFQVRSPVRNDKALPPELQDDTLCTFSKPFTLAEVKAGRVNLTVMHLAAEHPHHEFPMDLIKGDEGGQINEIITKKATDQSCWIVNPASLGAPTWADNTSGGQAGSSTPSSTSTSSTTERQRVPGNECSTRIVTKTTHTEVMSAGNELNGRLGFRFSTHAFNWGAALGCATKNNWSGVPVYGVVPWSAGWVGPTSAPPYGTNQPHVKNISCVIGSREFSWGDLRSSPIPLGSYVFNRASYPANQIRVQRFHVRPWGYPVDDLSADSAASFDVPLCPGSQFAYDNISLSWSPLILDIAGKGIEISRSFKRSVGFDIRGKGYISYVDWPENTKDVAFLVKPDAKGNVQSIKELFGDADGFENGFEKLKIYNSNKDEVIDVKDSEYSKLALWFDLNRDAKVQKQELQSLKSRGVERISLNYSRPSQGPAAPNRTLSGLYYNSQNKTMMNIEDHYFNEYEDSKRKEFETKRTSNLSK